MAPDSSHKSWTIDRLPSPRHLRVFEAVARLQSFTKAADEVRLTQPAVTQAIAKLESQVGKTLLERRPGGACLTAFGRKYLARTRRFFQHIENALGEISTPEDKANLLNKMFRISRTQMRCHLVIARSPSFAQAATEAGLSQPSLHRAARELELNLGVALYRTSASGMVTTEAGHGLARWFLLAFNEMESAAKELAAPASGESGLITIGVQILDPAPFLAVVMETFTRAHPDVAIKVISSTHEDLRQRIRLGLVDLTVGVLKDRPGDLHQEPLFPDAYVVAARRGHPLASLVGVTADQLLRYDWIVPNPGAPRRQAFDHLFRSLGRAPRASIESHSYATIRATLCDSDRLTILTRSELLADERMGVLQQLKAEPLQPIPIIGFTTQLDWAPTRRQQAFVALLRKHGTELAAKGETREDMPDPVARRSAP